MGEKAEKGTVVHGRATDQDGKPVAERGIWLVERSRGDMVDAEPAYLCAEDAGEVAARATTDREGRFALEGAPLGRARIGIAPQEGSDVAPVSVEIEVEADEAAPSIELRTYRGLAIRGRATLPDGSSAAGCRVEAKLQHWLLVGTATTDERGAFAIGALAPGELSLQAIHPGLLAPSDEIDAKAGASGIELRLRAAGSLRASVVDRETGKPDVATVYVSRRGAADDCTQHAGVGELALDRLEPGVYDLAAIAADGRAGVARGIRLESGALADGVKIGIGPGAHLTLRYAGAVAGGETFRLSSEEACIGWVSLQPGSSTTVGVPPGEIRIASMRPEPGERTVDVAAGGKATVTLGAR